MLSSFFPERLIPFQLRHPHRAAFMNMNGPLRKAIPPNALIEYSIGPHLNVEQPRDVAVNIKITDRGCWAFNETMVTIIPKPIGRISLEMSLDGDGRDVWLGDIIGYAINITNTGQTDINTLTLVYCYPFEALKPHSSDPIWKEDNGSSLIWNNLLEMPLAPGDSFKVHVVLRAIDATEQYDHQPGSS